MKKLANYIGLFVFFFMALYGMSRLNAPMTPTPEPAYVRHYDIGACLELNRPLKSWEAKRVWQIVKADDEAYAICVFEQGCKEYLQTGAPLDTIFFKEQGLYRLIRCNYE